MIICLSLLYICLERQGVSKKRSKQNRGALVTFFRQLGFFGISQFEDLLVALTSTGTACMESPKASVLGPSSRVHLTLSSIINNNVSRHHRAKTMKKQEQINHPTKLPTDKQKTRVEATTRRLHYNDSRNRWNTTPSEW